MCIKYIHDLNMIHTTMFSFWIGNNDFDCICIFWISYVRGVIEETSIPAAFCLSKFCSFSSSLSCRLIFDIMFTKLDVIGSSLWIILSVTEFICTYFYNFAIITEYKVIKNIKY